MNNMEYKDMSFTLKMDEIKEGSTLFLGTYKRLDGIRWRVKLMNGGKPIDLKNKTVKLFAKTGNDEPYYQEEGIEVINNSSGEVYIVPRSYLLNTVGIAVCEIEIFSSTGVIISSGNFSFKVIDKLNNLETSGEVGEAIEFLPQIREFIEVLKPQEDDRASSEIERKKSEAERLKNEEGRVDAEKLRVSAEGLRVESEAERKASEETRISFETDRNSKETTREQQEATRVASEGAREESEVERIANEVVRVGSEGTRAANETNRVAAEEIRLSNEEARVAAEDIRISSELDRAQVEADRVSNENARKSSEAGRADAESVRVSSENTRKSGETNRAEAEVIRASSEVERVEAEVVRVEQEAIRVDTESTRVSNETSRVNAENTRETNETGRVEAENTRVSSENTRVSNENTRKSNETSRVNAETSRTTKFTEIETKGNKLIGDMESALSGTIEGEVVVARGKFNNLGARLDEIENPKPLWTEVKGVKDITIDNSLEGFAKDLVVKGKTSYIQTADFASSNGGNIKVEGDIIDGTTKEISIKGRTLQNLCSKNNVNCSTGSSFSNDVVTVSVNTPNLTGVTFNNLLTQPNSTYTIILEVLELFNREDGVKMEINNGSYGFYNNMKLGKNVIVISTKEIYPSGGYFKILRREAIATSGQFRCKTPLILEGDWTNKPIPQYFEGIKSVGEDNKSNILLKDGSQSDNIVSSGEVEGNKIIIKSIGKNLLNSKLKMGALNTSGVEVSHTKALVTQDYVPILENKQYILSRSQNIFGVIYLYDKDFNRINTFNGAMTQNNRQFTTPSGTRYLKFYHDTLEDIKPMLEEGTIATEYEPYVEDKKEILLPFVGGLKKFDLLKEGMVIEGSGKYTFTGNETIRPFAIQDSANLDIGFSCYQPFLYKTNIGGVCNNFIVRAAVYLELCKGYSIGLHPDKNVYFRIPKSELETPDVAGFKKWLQANPTTVVYELATPAIHNIEKMSLNAYKGTTHFSCESNVEPSNMEVYYPVEERESNTWTKHCRVESVGSNEENKIIARSVGKNLFPKIDINNPDNGWVSSGNGSTLLTYIPSVDGFFTRNHRRKRISGLKPNTIYTMSVETRLPLDTPATGFAILHYHPASGGGYVTELGRPTSNEYKKYSQQILSNKDGGFAFILYGGCILKNGAIQLEESTTATEYEPYQEYKKEIIIPYEGGLKEIPNIAVDTVDYNGAITEKIKYHIFTGDENISLRRDKENTILFLMSKPDSLGLSNVLVSTISNKLKSGKGSDLYNLDIEGCSNDSDKTLRFSILKSRLETNTVEGFKKLLKKWNTEGNPLIIYYALATPIIHNIEKRSLSTFEGATHIMQDNNICGEITCQAPADRDASIKSNTLAIRNTEQKIKDLASYVPTWQRYEGEGHFTLEDSFDGTIKDLVIKGKTIGGFNSETGQSDNIVSSGEAEGNKIIVKSCGKNLFDVNANCILGNGERVNNSIKQKVNGNLNPVFKISNLVIGKTYKLTGIIEHIVEPVAGALYYCVQTKNGHYDASSKVSGSALTISPNNKLNVEFTATQNEVYVIGSTKQNLFKNIQLEPGTIATDYEPYVEDKKEILLPCPHRELNIYEGETGKYIENSSGKVLNGTETWAEASKTGTTRRFYLVPFDKKVGRNKIFCDKLPYVADEANEIEGISDYTSDGRIYIKLNENKLTGTSSKSIKDWLQANPVKIVYQLATPVIHNIERVRPVTFDRKTHIIQDNAITGETNFEAQVSLRTQNNLLQRSNVKLAEDNKTLKGDTLVLAEALKSIIEPYMIPNEEDANKNPLLVKLQEIIDRYN